MRIPLPLPNKFEDFELARIQLYFVFLLLLHSSREEFLPNSFQEIGAGKEEETLKLGD